MSEYGEIKSIVDDGQAVIVESGGIEFKAELIRPVGDGSTPIVGDIVYCQRLTGHRERVAVAFYDQTVQPTTEGGKLIYSRNSDGERRGFIEITPDGNIKLNGDGKSLVTHSELDTALQLMVDLINAGLAAKVNVAGAPAAVTLDISSSETTSVKTSG